MEAGQKPVFLDVRTPGDFEASPLKLPGATRLAPETAEAERLELALDRQQRIVTYCASPNEESSARVTRLLRRRGYRHLRILKGGLGGWTNAGLPVESKAHLPSIGVELYKSLAAGQLQARQFPAGQAIFNEGDDAKGEAFLIHSGRVDIHKRVDGGDQLLRTLAEGELLGELALIREMPRSAGAVAATDVQLLVIDRQHLDWLIRNRPELTLEILKRMSGWLAEGLGASRPPEPAAGPPPPGRTPNMS
jgi:rhodanese-related sulfurtransferase